MHDDDETPRALTPAERRRLEAELATLERELPELEARADGAYAAYLLAQGRETEDRAWSAFKEHVEVERDARARAADLRQRLADDDTRADHAAWAAYRGVR